MQDRVTKAMPPFSPGLTNQPCSNMASTAVMLTLCLCNRAALRLAKRDPDSVSRSPSNRHARLTPPPLSPRSLPLPTMTQRFQLVTSPLNSCNPFEPRWVVGTQETHAAELHLRHSSIRHGITYRPFALGFSLLPQPSNAARPQVRNLSSGCFSPAAWRRPCFANRKSLTRGQPYGTFHDDPTACMMQELFHRLPNH
jgi:hypothetical protein